MLDMLNIESQLVNKYDCVLYNIIPLTTLLGYQLPDVLLSYITEIIICFYSQFQQL